MAESNPNSKKRERRKDERPDEIVRAAIEVFCKEHYAKTTFGLIAQKLGIARGTIYLYFPDKPALFKACIHEVFSQKKEMIRNSSVNSSMTLEEKLKSYIHVVSNTFSEGVFSEFLIMVLSESRTDPILGQIWFEEVVCELKKIWDEGMANENIDDNSKKLLLIEMISPFLLSAISHRLFSDKSIHPNSEVLENILPSFLLSSLKNNQEG